MHHVFARLGKYRHPQLREEFREIIKEKGLQEDDPYDDVVHRSEMLDVDGELSFDEFVGKVSESLAGKFPIDSGEIRERLLETGRYGGAPLSKSVLLLHFRHKTLERAEMALVRIPEGLRITLEPEVIDCLVYVIAEIGQRQRNTKTHNSSLVSFFRNCRNWLVWFGSKGLAMRKKAK